MADHDARVEPDAIEPHRAGDVITAALVLYGRHWKLLVPIAAVVAMPLAVAAEVISFELAIESFSIDERGRVSADVGALVIATVVAIVISLLASSLVTAAVTQAVASGIAGKEPSIGRSYRRALPRLAAVLIASLIVGVAVGVASLALLIPGVFLLVRWSVAVPAIVVERLGPIRGMGRSWRLVRGHGWHVLAAVLTALLISFVIGWGFSVVSPPDTLWRGILAGVADTIVIPFVALVYALLYLDLRARDETLGRATLAAELER